MAQVGMKNLNFPNFPDGNSYLHSISDSLKSLSFSGSNSGLRLCSKKNRGFKKWF